MNCPVCRQTVKYCWKCGKKFKKQNEIKHIIYTWGINKSVYHICIDCYNDIMLYSKWKGIKNE